MKRIFATVLTLTTLFLIVAVHHRFRPQTVPEDVPPSERPGGTSPLREKPGLTERSPEEATTSITEANLKELIHHLAGQKLEGRMSGKQGNRSAAEWLKARHELAGLQTMYHRFPMGRFNPGPKNETGDDFSQNLYAWIDGADVTARDEIVVVGAHMDHIGYGPRASQAPSRREVHPGADDNASGTAALMEIARAMSLVRNHCKRTVVFQSYSGEEMGLIGSAYYCNNPVFPKNSPSIQKHVAMINMDMIGRLGKSGLYQASFHSVESSPDLSKLVGELSARYPFARSITGRGGGGSDHAPFYNKRVPVVCLHTGMHSQYHTPEDTPDRINYAGLEKIARYAFELAYRVAAEDKRPVFDHAGFQEMPLVDEHGRPFRFYDPKP